MACISEFLEIIDSSADKGRFPTWDFDEDYAFFGSMRVSGFNSEAGVALVFEYVEYSVLESIIQNVAVCLATFPVPNHLIVGDAIFIGYHDLLDPQFHETFYGTIRPISRGRSFEVHLDETKLKQEGYLDPDADKPSLPSILFMICDTVPSKWLYNEPDFLIQNFDMGPDARRLFFLEEWQHLSLGEVYEEEIKPSGSPDIVALVEAVCQGIEMPKLKGKPNTTWRAQGRIGS